MSPTKLKVIALISGGKDSLFSILHCLANGHDVVALANLHPPISEENKQDDDIDSFMYQTVGHQIVPLYAEALGIPLFRQEIVGAAVNGEREYGLASGSLGMGEADETESLVPLLKRIIEVIPDANAISTGAILSTYQRTRVESVALRLGLVPLSFLWQYLYLPPYEQTSLLDDMRSVGQVAKIIKVASGGLDESFLWQDVASEALIARMRRKMSMFGGGEGGALIGEGGEFETLAVDGPRPFWKKRIVVKSADTVAGDGGVASVRLLGTEVVEKDDIAQTHGSVRVPALLDDEFETLLRRIGSTISPEPPPDTIKEDILEFTYPDVEAPSASQQDRGGRYLHISNLRTPPYGSPQDQMEDIKHQLLFKLHGLSLDSSAIVHTTILLRDMSTFGAINSIYGSIFTKPNPPSRVTVSCGSLLPSGIHIVLSVLVDRAPLAGVRDGLHVQSQSYWAPANIGPYSQAICTPIEVKSRSHDSDKIDASEEAHGSARIVYVAGQIPLVPASMEQVTPAHMPSSDTQLEPLGSEQMRAFIVQSVLALQHLWRIGRAMEVVTWTGAVAFISHCSLSEAKVRARAACATWQLIHNILSETSETNDEEDAVEHDIWDIKNRIAELSTFSPQRDIRPRLPDYSKIQMAKPSSEACLPPVYTVQVSELPRAADIEWCSTGIAGATKVTYSMNEQAQYIRHSCEFHDERGWCGSWAYVAVKDVENVTAFLAGAEAEGQEVITVYATVILPDTFWDLAPDAMLIPCFGIWGFDSGGEPSNFQALVIMNNGS